LIGSAPFADKFYWVLKIIGVIFGLMAAVRRPVGAALSALFVPFSSATKNTVRE
jgi:hypothetical protein